MTVPRAASACGATEKSVEEWLAGVGPRMEPAMRAAIEKEAGILQPVQKIPRDPIIVDVLAHVEAQLALLLADGDTSRRSRAIEHFKRQIELFADYARDVSPPHVAERSAGQAAAPVSARHRKRR